MAAASEGPACGGVRMAGSHVPARYSASGIMSFMANHEGVIYEKNLGRKTTEVAAEITSFNPDASWKKQ